MSKSPSGKSPRSNRRTFLKSSGLMTAVAVGSAAIPKLPTAAAAKPIDSARSEAMPTRNLGKTGYKVGIFSLGGQAALEQANNFDVAVPIIERALDLGVNYIDTSSIYGGPDRWSEQYVGKVMATAARGVSRDQDEGTHARRLDAHDREVAASCSTPIMWTSGSCTTSAR